MSVSTSLYDTIIAGAGPVGLFLACELSLAGCSVLVLEREKNPPSPLKRAPFGLRGLTVPTIESFDRRGLLAEIEARAASRATPGTAHFMSQARRPGGHFAGIQFFHDRIETARWQYRLPGVVGGFAAEIRSIEAVLIARAEASGVRIVRGAGIEGFNQTDAAVAVEASGRTFRGRWLVGCDGARSVVRKAAGIAFTGTEPEFTGYSIQADLAGADALKPGRHYTAQGMYLFTPPGTLALADFDGGAFHRSARVTRAHAEAVLRRISDADVTVTTLHLATTWTDRAHQASTYRSGRVLLAGGRGAHPFSVGRTGSQPRARRRDEPRLEARRDGPGRGAGRPARQLRARAASGRGARARLVQGPGRPDAAEPKLPRARSYRARPDRDAGRRDLLRRARLGRLPPPRHWRRASAGRVQRSRLQLWRREECRCPDARRKGLAP